MIFGPTPLDQALGAILAHSLQTAEGKLSKGQVLTRADLAAIAATGQAEVMAARLEPGDIPEDSAAARLAAALGADGLTLTQPHAGRVNLVAQGPGLFDLDPEAVHRLNLCHPSLTLASLPPLTRLQAGTLAATVKIIAYSVPEAALRQAEALARTARPRLVPVILRRASLILTEAPGDAALGAKLASKAREATRRRLSALGIELAEVLTCPHALAPLTAALGRAGGDLVLILTGAATSDCQDVAPSAVRAAGGQVARFGMPVDPGNLLFHGQIGARPLIGLPGCARSAALNGADFVLERIACGMTITDEMIARMGVGGLLKEIPQRPAPREGKARLGPGPGAG